MPNKKEYGGPAYQVKKFGETTIFQDGCNTEKNIENVVDKATLDKWSNEAKEWARRMENKYSREERRGHLDPWADENYRYVIYPPRP